MEGFSLEEYLSNGVEKVVKGIVKAAVRNPKAGLFFAKYAAYSKKARKLRKEAELRGTHIPAFLIASITSQCNLHCRGCYARANHSCQDEEITSELMTCADWSRVFSQAEELGIEFVILVGGEPFMRMDVIKEAGRHRKVLFPVFTNGTMLKDEYLTLLQENPNVLPVISIEGNKKSTDDRRGTGIYEQICAGMQTLEHAGILFGASVTVTTQNMEEVLAEQFVQELADRGTKAIIYVEYVPVDGSSEALAPGDAEREIMRQRIQQLRESGPDILLISFPGDEKTSGGCLAAGRGFFHINAKGGAEPCPLSPYSDTNLKETTLLQALNSPLFQTLKENGNLTEEHIGGCVLFEQKEQVERIVKEESC